MNNQKRETILNINRVTAQISHRKYLKEISWQICPGQFWAVLGTDASGKSGLGELLAGRVEVISGEITARPERTGYVSFIKHAEIMDDLIRNDETDFLDCIDTGTVVNDFICNSNRVPVRRFSHKIDQSNPLSSLSEDLLLQQKEPSQTTPLQRRAQTVADRFGISHLLQRGIRFLSTGEIRKVMICQAVVHDPELLVLDEPYDGLDSASRITVADTVASLSEQGMAVVLILNRFSEIPQKATHILYISDCMIQLQGTRKEILGEADNSEKENSGSGYSSSSAITTLEKLHNLHYTLPALLPEKDRKLSCSTLSSSSPSATQIPMSHSSNNATLVKMVDTTVIYGNNTVLNRISWEVKKGEHWKISGPNGAGKSTLLSLVNGDNPQAYCNHIELFGIRRGSGESVWEIKRHTGIVSSQFQLDYRVSSSVTGVVISGFFDSIGVYRRPTERQKRIAMEWLTIIGMKEHARKPFRTLSYGEQRMVLIARAMVKHPPLLILDEPCQGLDEINRQMVLKLIDHIGKSGESTLLYVTHHEEDYIECITHTLQFVPESSGAMSVVIS